MFYSENQPSISLKTYAPPKVSKPLPAVISLTIRQLLSLKKENEIQNQKFSNIILVGKFLSHRIEDNRRKIVFSDGSGTITLTVLLGDEKTNIDNKEFYQMIGSYAFVSCTPKYRKQEKEWIYFMDNGRKVKDYDQITKHMSDAVLSYLERTH